MGYFTFFLYKAFEIRCVFYAYSILQLGLVTFPVFSGHMCLVSTILDRTGKDHIICYFYSLDYILRISDVKHRPD